MRPAPILSALIVLAQPLLGQDLQARVKESYRTWNALLERGDAQTVRSSTEALLDREARSISTTDYGAMQALVALRDVAARACVLDGRWEEGMAHLQQAASVASDNVAVFQSTAARLRKDHEANLAKWRATVADLEARLKDLEERPGLSESQIKLRTQLRTALEEHRAAIAHSEWALQELDRIADQLQKEKDAYAASLAAWQAFLDKEKDEREAASSLARYVTEKFQQVRLDDARPRFERLAYARRLLRLDPSNAEVARFVQALLGVEAPAEPAPPPRRKKTARKP